MNTPVGTADAGMKSSAYELHASKASKPPALLLTVTPQPRRMKDVMQMQPAEFRSRRSHQYEEFEQQQGGQRHRVASQLGV